MTDPTIIRAQTLVQGNLTGEDPVEVEGQLIGQVTLQNTLTVQPGGLVRGKIHVRQAIIHGRLEGALTATERVYLAPSAVVIADLDAPLVRVDDGARLHGKLLMALDAPLPAVAPLAIKADAPRVAPQAEPTKPAWGASPPSFTSTRPAAVAPVVTAPVVTAPVVTAPVVTAPVVTAPAVTAPSFTSTRPVTASPAAQAAPVEAPRTATTVVEPEPVKVVEPAAEVVEAPVIAAAVEPAVEVAVEPAEVTEVVEAVEPAQIISSAPAQDAGPDADQEADPDAAQDAHDDDPAAHMSAEAAKYEHYTVKELREELRRLDLPVSGSKEDLIERLISAQ